MVNLNYRRKREKRSVFCFLKSLLTWQKYCWSVLSWSKFIIIVCKRNELVKYESDDVFTKIDSKQEQTFYKGYIVTYYIYAWSYQMQQATYHVEQASSSFPSLWYTTEGHSFVFSKLIYSNMVRTTLLQNVFIMTLMSHDSEECYVQICASAYFIVLSIIANP